MNLTREECGLALHSLFEVANNYDLGNPGSKNNKCNREFFILDELIDEHFDNKEQVKFYYCESENSYLIGKRVDNFYYAHWYPRLGFVFDMGRYLPWGEHIVAPDALWKEHTYPSEPKEIDFNTWIKGFVKVIENYNPPLTIEELDDILGKPIWCNKNKEWFLLREIIIRSSGINELELISMNGIIYLVEFEEGRFYRKQVEEKDV